MQNKCIPFQKQEKILTCQQFDHLFIAECLSLLGDFLVVVLEETSSEFCYIAGSEMLTIPKQFSPFFLAMSGVSININ